MSAGIRPTSPGSEPVLTQDEAPVSFGSGAAGSLSATSALGVTGGLGVTSGLGATGGLSASVRPGQGRAKIIFAVPCPWHQ